MTTFTKLGDEDLSVVTVKILYAKTVLFIVFVIIKNYFNIDFPVLAEQPKSEKALFL